MGNDKKLILHVYPLLVKKLLKHTDEQRSSSSVQRYRRATAFFELLLASART